MRPHLSPFKIYGKLILLITTDIMLHSGFFSFLYFFGLSLIFSFLLREAGIKPLTSTFCWFVFQLRRLDFDENTFNIGFLLLLFFVWFFFLSTNLIERLHVVYVAMTVKKIKKIIDETNRQHS